MGNEEKNVEMYFYDDICSSCAVMIEVEISDESYDKICDKYIVDQDNIFLNLFKQIFSIKKC